MGSYHRTRFLYIILFRIWYITNTDKSSRDMINLHFKL